MAKLYNTKGNKAIMYYIKKKGCTKTEVAKLLDVSNATLHKYLNNPYHMTLKQLISLCGLFECSIHELVYLVSKNKAKADNKAKWYLNDVVRLSDIIQYDISKV